MIVDESKLNAFVGRMLGDLGGAEQALALLAPPDTLAAAKCRLDQRLVLHHRCGDIEATLHREDATGVHLFRQHPAASCRYRLGSSRENTGKFGSRQENTG